MMECRICGFDIHLTCCCGFCMICIKAHGHDKCHEIISKKDISKEED